MSAERRTERNDTGVSLHEAVAIGREFLQGAYPDGVEDMQLEEIDRSDDERYWLLTFGFIRHEPSRARGAFTLLPELHEQGRARIYTVVTIDAFSGTVKSMKIRVP